MVFTYDYQLTCMPADKSVQVGVGKCQMGLNSFNEAHVGVGEGGTKET